MIFWNNIVNTALLGTAKKPVQPGELLTQELASYSEVLKQEGDAEETYLQAAALAFNYRQCGMQPLKKEVLPLGLAPEEDKAYCNPQQQALLQEVLDTEVLSLLKLWLLACWKSGLIVLPELIPALLDIGAKQVNYQKIILECTGNRGKWLQQFNAQWQFLDFSSGEDVWTTGTFEQRKKLLRHTLRQDAPAAKAMLQKTWAEENANAKADFLKLLADFVVQEDEEWLTGLLQDKSQKVKQEAWALLKRVPTSFITTKYKATLLEAVQLNKKERGIIGISIGTKTELRLQLPEKLDEDLFRSGIEKISSVKGVSDEVHILYQLIQQTPLQWLEQALELPQEEIILLFKKNDLLKRFIPALADAMTMFKDQAWALVFYKHLDEFYPGLALLLPQELQTQYLINHLERNSHVAISLATQLTEEWNTKLAREIVRFTAQSPYQYNRAFYNQVVPLLPAQLMAELDSLAPSDSYARATWNNLSDHIKHLLVLKKQIKDLFPSQS